MSPELSRLGHVALDVPDLEASLRFYRDSVGLEEVEREGDTAYLRAVEEFDHHSLRLRESGSAGVDHIGWQTEDQQSIDGFAERLRDQGIDVARVEAGEERGQGEAIRFQVPHGHEFEIYHEMEKPDPPKERRSKLKNKSYISAETSSIAPLRVDHVQIWDTDAFEAAEWMQETLGLSVMEYYDQKDGSRWGTFLSASKNKIEAAVIQGESDDDCPGLHHIAFTSESAEDLFNAADTMNERGYPIDGLGQHSISRGKFLYVRDDSSGHRVEFNVRGYLVFDPNWEPIAWQEGDLDDRQWIGEIRGLDTVKYN
ncbi:VOC family protein [Halostagnicola bangensis]